MGEGGERAGEPGWGQPPFTPAGRDAGIGRNVREPFFSQPYSMVSEDRLAAGAFGMLFWLLALRIGR